MRLVDQFSAVERELPERWATARLRLKVTDDGRCDRAAGLLGPATPGRRGNEIRFEAGRRGAALGPDAIRRLLRRLDQEGITGEVQILRALSDTFPVYTQGPVWYVGGRAV